MDSQQASTPENQSAGQTGQAADTFFDPASALVLIGNSEPVFLNILGNFRDLYADLPDLIPGLVAGGNKAELIHWCHNLKSIASYAGSPAVAARAGVVCQHLRELTGLAGPLPAEMARELQDLAAELRKLLQTITVYLDAKAAAEAAEADALANLPDDLRPLMDVLQTFSQQLDIHDPIASRKTLKQLQSQAWPVAIDAELDRVGDLVVKYRFDQAHGIIEQLIKNLAAGR
jgi:HPt (histidine-containing phosphotransfer) domain-containing protein